jgi:pimeloyl-ACP methyl ester carboxylesterase
MEQRQQGGLAFICGQWPLDRQKPTILFIHGAGESSLLWHAQVEGLKDRANTVALDLPGHGRSRGRAKRRVRTYAADLVDFMHAIAAPGPIPCGLSMGGAITQQLLLDHGDCFRAGIIVSSGAKLRVLPALFEMLAQNFPAYVEMVDQLGFSEKTAADVKRPFLEEHLKARPKVAEGDFRACDRFDVMARIASIQVPVLVISAADDIFTPPKYAEFLAEHIPGSRRAHIPDAGHFVPIEKPQAVNAVIAEFLEEMELLR